MVLRSSLASLFIAVSLVNSGYGSQKGKPTNLEVLNSQIDSLSNSLADVLSEEYVRSFQLRTGENTIAQVVRQRLLERFLSRSYKVSSDSAGRAVVRVLVPLVEVTYSSPVASHIFGASDVMRSVRSEYDVEVSDSSRVRFARSFSLAFRDTVSESDISDLEAGSYSFLRGRIESRSFFDSFVQPVLFVASAAVIVYLFFTLRGS